MIVNYAGAVHLQAHVIDIGVMDRSRVNTGLNGDINTCFETVGSACFVYTINKQNKTKQKK